MPSQPTVTEICMNAVLSCLTPMLTLLNEVMDAFGTPFMRAISSTTLSLIIVSQNAKRNKDECIQFMENIHGILYAIIDLHITSETGGGLLPATLDHIGNFMQILHKIHTFVEAQQDGNRIKYFFRQNEMNKLRKDCQAGLEEALKVFKVETGLIIANNMAKMHKKTQSMHQELLDLVEYLSDGSTSDGSSSIYQTTTNPNNSLNSFSLLPAQPKIFHGREWQIEEIVVNLMQQSAHIAILGAGGIGKTSLARAALHHPDVAAKYEHRFFVVTDSVTTSVELITMRGVERPAKVRWTRPFLEPLKPLSYDAAHQTFIEIADDFHNPQEVDELLRLTANMPLAVNLIAHLVDYEGCSSVLARWETEKTSLLSTGYDRQSSLDASITMSLASPRLKPGAKDLLSLLSILPDELSAIELIEYLYEKYRGVQLNNTRINQITANLGNLHQLLLLQLHVDSTELVDTINCTISLNYFHWLTGHGCIVLMNNIPAVMPQPCDHQLEARYVTETLYTMVHHAHSDPESLVQQGMSHFHHINDPVLEARFYIAVGRYIHHSNGDFNISQQSFEKALSLAKFYGDLRQHSTALQAIAQLKSVMGDHSAARMHALEAQQIAQLSANLYQEAVSVNMEAVCVMWLGDLKQSVLLCHRARELLQLCGMQGGRMDHGTMIALAEVHRLKSEYLEAHSIHVKLVQNACGLHDPIFNAHALLNIAELDAIIGVETLKVQHNLDTAKTIFTTWDWPDQ
ncbi:hypothetical protein C8R44DRAFT_904175 [Mycena epipterygia]|nr:hypothetical protein C8R44DRAFT_904175 [Mycena epipterygia]